MSWKCTILGHDYERVHAEMIDVYEYELWTRLTIPIFYVLRQCSRCGHRDAYWKNERGYSQQMDVDYCIHKFTNYKEKK